MRIVKFLKDTNVAKEGEELLLLNNELIRDNHGNYGYKIKINKENFILHHSFRGDTYSIFDV